MKQVSFYLIAVALITMNCGTAHGQGCALSMIPEYSSYASVSGAGTSISTLVTVQGYAEIEPSAGCDLEGVTHQGRAYNLLSTTGGWVDGPKVSPSSYISVTNSQTIPATPGVSYPFTWNGEVYCSEDGVFFAAAGGGNLELPTISGPNTFWTFNGQSPSGYATSITLTSSGGAGTTWSVSAGASEVYLSSTSGASINVSTSGTAFSTQPGDIKIVATAGGLSSAPFAVTSRTPYRLVAGEVTTTCGGQFGYLSLVPYIMEDNLLATFPSTIGINEAWTSAAVNDYTAGEDNWTQGTPYGLASTNSQFSDEIGGAPAGSSPVPTCPGPATPVQHWGQEWYIGSVTPGAGTPVQTDSLQKYLNSADHLSIKSPVTAP